jgi:hypothetical protein
MFVTVRSGDLLNVAVTVISWILLYNLREPNTSSRYSHRTPSFAGLRTRISQPSLLDCIRNGALWQVLYVLLYEFFGRKQLTHEPIQLFGVLR